MYGYKLQKPKGLSKTIWACKTAVDHYSWENANKPNMIEFGLCKAEKRTIIVRDHAPLTVDGETFGCLVGNEAVQSFAESGVTVDIVSVAVSFDELCYTAKEFDEEDLEDCDTLLLPHVIEGGSKQDIIRLDRLLNQFIHSYMERSAASDMKCQAIVFELLSMFDEIVRHSGVNKKNKYTNYYVAKADSIILNRYFEKLTLNTVAKELGITPNYLSAIYKSSTGNGFSERLCEVRMNQAKQLLLKGDLPLFEISQRVGFDDDSHLRRRFKQYFGVSVREYSCIAKEQTLYHKKPQAEKEEI